jgi:hypothetical protein
VGCVAATAHAPWGLTRLGCGLAPPHSAATPTPTPRALKASLARFGRLARLAAYANTTTLTQYVGKEGLQEEVEAGELRCELCGR